MGQVAEAWLECQKRIDDYVDEEVTMRTKQCFRKEDWEGFKQRHFVEQLIGKNVVSGENSFTDTMRHLLSSRLNISDCPNCNYRRRCTCDDCSLSHILMCGIMDSTVPDDAHSNNLPLQIDSTQDYLSEIHLPNMSSGSESSSPFIVHQIDRPRFILTEDDNGPTFNIENEDVSPVPEKRTDMYSMNQYDDTEIARDADGINKQLNDDIERSALMFESPQESSISSSSSEADAEEANETNSTNLPIIKEGDLMLGRSVMDKEAKMDRLSSSYAIQQQVDQGTVHCECHVCKQEASEPSASDSEMRCLPASHQFKIPEKPAHPALHLYPHIHGQIPFHTIPSLSPPRIHPSLYTVSPFTQNKQVLSTSFQDHIYPSGLGNATDWKNSKFLSLWGSEIMNEKDWSGSTFLQNGLSGSDSVASTLSDVGPNVFPIIPRNEELVVFDSKKSENIVKKKCLYHCQDSFMDSNKVVMATSSATSSVSCTATTVQSSNNQFKVSSKRSSLGDVLHSINSEDNRFSVSAVAQNNPTSLVPVPSLCPVVSSTASIPCLPSPNTPSFSRVTTTAPSFIDPHTVLYSTTVAPPLTTENLISPPPSVCSDPVCEGHHCENTSMCDHQQYDGEESQDGDSCSEHSSSTSTSTNQKEGKYCDCCYCEFFGHGGPPAAPTSRNYAEMREKLRLRLTKRKEGQPRQLESISDRQSIVDHRKVEDLLQFINSDESRPVSSTRTAKRARHKQKKLKEKVHAETEARKQEQNQLLDQQQQDDVAMQQLQDLQTVKKKKKERISNNCDEEKAHNQKYQVVRKPSPESQESLQNELLDKTDTSTGLLSKHPDNVVQESASETFCEQPIPMNGRDSKLLFTTEMTVKSNEPLSLLLNIMHHHTEDKSKQQITQISKLLKKTSKATDAQPKIKNKMQSKIKVAELQSLAAPRKEDKKVSQNKAKQMNPAKKSSLEKNSFLPSESLPNKLLQDSPQPKGKSKKNKKKKNNRGNFSVDDVFLPKDVDLDNVEMDETEREVEHFKRFCLDSARQTRQRLSINWSNFSLKKTAFAVH